MSRMRNQMAAAAIVAAACMTAPAQAQLNCNVVESIGNALADSIRTELDGSLRGYTEKISRRKTLVINGVDSVSFRGCKAAVVTDATLKRKIRSNAHGKITLSGNVTRFTSSDVCVARMKVENVSLSRTLNIGENVYKRVANRAIPGAERCFAR